jgi:hypothetical protein
MTTPACPATARIQPINRLAQYQFCSLELFPAFKNTPKRQQKKTNLGPGKNPLKSIPLKINQQCE